MSVHDTEFKIRLLRVPGFKLQLDFQSKLPKNGETHNPGNSKFGNLKVRETQNPGNSKSKKLYPGKLEKL